MNCSDKWVKVYKPRLIMARVQYAKQRIGAKSLLSKYIYAVAAFLAWLSGVCKNSSARKLIKSKSFLLEIGLALSHILPKDRQSNCT